jgi:fatty acid desaturase
MQADAGLPGREIDFEADQRFARQVDRKALADLTRELSKVSNGAALWAIARQWIAIAAAVAFVVYVDRWWAWLIAAIVIATRQHALLALMHEASHYHLLSNRKLNDIIGDLFCAFPTNITTVGYRYQHGEHHRHTNTEQDPYWVLMQAQPGWHFPRTPLRAAAVFLGDCLGFYLADHAKAIGPWTYLSRLAGKSQPKLTAEEHLRYVLFMGTLITSLTLAGGWLHYLLLWIVPQSTVMMAFFRLRGLAEHPLEEDNTLTELQESRDNPGRLIERIMIAPMNINYHLTHHLFPSIPFNNLPKMHARLAQEGLFEKGVNTFDVYLGLDEKESVTGYLTREPHAPVSIQVSGSS